MKTRAAKPRKEMGGVGRGKVGEAGDEATEQQRFCRNKGLCFFLLNNLYLTWQIKYTSVIL